MQLRIANAPTSWGVEDPEDGANPPWDRLLNELATAGYAGTELGDRNLALVGGYVFEPLDGSAGVAAALEVGRRTCELLAAAGAAHLVIIQGFTPDRERAAGRPGAAPPLDDSGWATLVDGVDQLARLASEHGLAGVFHPHAGTHVEFEDEIDRLVGDTDVPLCIDTGHCAYAGIDPVALIERLGDRVAYLHLKDIDSHRLRAALALELSFEEAVGERVFCPLGEGVVDFAALAGVLGDYEGWATVEQDRLPTDSTAPADHAAASLAHLRAAGLA